MLHSRKGGLITSWMQSWLVCPQSECLELLGWPKKFIWFFCTILQKSPKELSQPNIFLPPVNNFAQLVVIFMECVWVALWARRTVFRQVSMVVSASSAEWQQQELSSPRITPSCNIKSHNWCMRGFPGGASGKEPTCQCRRQDMGLILGSGKSPGEENGNPLQYSCLENPMDRGAWRATVHGVSELDTAEATYHAGIWSKKKKPFEHATRKTSLFHRLLRERIHAVFTSSLNIAAPSSTVYSVFLQINFFLN